MTDKTIGKNRSGSAPSLHDGFRQRLPHRPILGAQDITSSIKARMAAAKSGLRLERGAPPAPQPSTPPVQDAHQDINETPEASVIETSVTEARVTKAFGHQPIEPKNQAEEFQTNDGFQIFKSRSVPNKPILDTPELSQNLNQDDDVNKSAASKVDPVPMAPDAIEDALRLIEDEDGATDHNDQDQVSAIGFTPSNLLGDTPESDPFPIGNFGVIDEQSSGSPSASADPEMSPDEIAIAAALSTEIEPSDDETSAAKSHQTTTELITNPANDDDQSRLTVANASAVSLDVMKDDERRNMEIGHHMANSIRSIISSEVDETLDRIARQAVRDALKAHRAT